MPADVFGDLQEWGDVLEILEDLRKAEALDHHQSGLARLIRCRSNWRLQEGALISAAQVRSPSRVLVEAALALLRNDEELLENRILAAHALGAMLAAGRAQSECEVAVDQVLASMKGLLREDAPPVFRGAIRRACGQAESAS